MSDIDFGDPVVWFWILLIFIGLPWTIWNFDLNVFSNEISAYKQVRNCDKHNQSCQWANDEMITYKIFLHSQKVVYWSNTNRWPLKQLNNCAIASKRHWSCKVIYGDTVYNTHGFNAGRYAQESTDSYRYVYKTTWWLNGL